MTTAETPISTKSKTPFMQDSSSGAKPRVRDQNEYFAAKPQARPITSWGTGGSGLNASNQQPVSRDQAELLADIRKGQARTMVRPQTAATTSIKDETRILNKLKYLEKIEQRIEEDLEQFVNRRGDKSKDDKKGIAITKEMLLECS